MTVPPLSGSEDEEQYINAKFYKKGGMGEIFIAQDIVNSKDIVVKLIPICDNDELLFREVDALSKLEHRNIVKTHISGKVLIHDMEYYYIIQDFYPNGNLRENYQKDISIEECFRMFNNLLDGLQEIHTIIIHRDLKPENILDFLHNPSNNSESSIPIYQSTYQIKP